MKNSKGNNTDLMLRSYEWAKKHITTIYVLWSLFVLYTWFHDYQILPSNIDFDQEFLPQRAYFIYSSGLLLPDTQTLAEPTHGFSPLFGLILTLSHTVLPFEISSMIFVSTLLGIIVIICAIYIACKAYNHNTVITNFIIFFFPLSLWLLFYSRTSCGQFVMGPLTYMIVLYTAYLSLEKRHYLIISGVLWGIGLLNLYHTLWLLPVIVLLFLISDKKLKFFSMLPYYLGFVLSGLVTYAIFELIIDYALGLKQFAFAKHILYQHLGVQIEHITKAADMYSFPDRVAILFKNLFVSYAFLKRYPPEEPSSFIEGYPLIFPFVSICFFFGLIRFFFVKRDAFDKLLMCWLLVPAFAYTFISLPSTRYIITILPAIFLIAGNGFEFLWYKFRDYSAGSRYFKKFLLFILVSIFLLSCLQLYQGYYVTFRNRDTKVFGVLYGERQIAQYINAKFADSDPSSVLLVIDGACYHYWGELSYEMRLPIKVMRWGKFKSEFVKYGGHKFFANMPYDTVAFALFDPSNIHATGIYSNSIEEFFDLFSHINPILPDNVVLSSTGAPAIDIYVVSTKKHKDSSLTNFVVNGSFEEGRSGWTGRAQDPSRNMNITSSISALISDDDSVHGKSSLRLSASSNEAALSQTIKDLKQNTWYKLSFYYKNNKGYPIRVILKQHADRKQLLKSEFIVPSSAVPRLWNYHEQSFYATYGGSADLTLYSGDYTKDGGSSTVGETIVTLFDDIEVIEYTGHIISKTIPSNNMVVNGSFEAGCLLEWADRAQNGFPNTYIKPSISAVISDDNSVHGKSSLRLSASSNEAALSQTIKDLKQNTWYKLSFYYKNNKGYPIRVRLKQHADQKQLLRQEYRAPYFFMSKRWNYYEQSFYATHGGAADLTLYSGDYRKSGTFFFGGDIIVTLYDDIKIVESNETEQYSYQRNFTKYITEIFERPPVSR